MTDLENIQYFLSDKVPVTGYTEDVIEECDFLAVRICNEILGVFGTSRFAFWYELQHKLTAIAIAEQ